MNPSLDQKSILIIGGTSGIGLSGAKACLAAGANVTVVGLENEHSAQARDELGGNTAFLFADAMDPQTAERAVAEAVNCFGRLDGLCHVAGGSGRRKGDGPLHEISDEGWQYTLQLNLSSLFYSNRAAVRQFLKQGTGGVVLNVSSVLGYSPSPKHFSTHAYTASKAAINGLTVSTASYYASHNIRINAVAPGLVETPMSQRALGNEEIMRFTAQKQPLDGGRVGMPSDLDGAVVFFLSDQSKFITGQILAIDGGWSVSEGT